MPLKKGQKVNLKLLMIPTFSNQPKWFLILFCFLGLLSESRAKEIRYSGKDLIIGKYLEIAEDAQGVYRSTDVDKIPFVPSIENTPNFGFSSSIWWVKFTVKNASNDDVAFLELGYPMIHTGELYRSKNLEIPLQKISSEDVFSKRNPRHQNMVFRLELNPGETETYYLKIHENTQIVLPLFIRSQEEFVSSHLTTQIVTGVYIGILLVMMLYNLFLYFSIRENSYLFYVLYIFFIGLTQLTLTGYGFKLLWPFNPAFNAISGTVLSALSGLFAVLFFRNFLNTKDKTPLFDKGLFLIIVSYGLSVVFKFAGFHELSYMLTNISGLGSVFIAIIVSAILSAQRYRPAMFFLIAWSIFFLGLALFVLRNLNILPFNNFTNYTMQAGTAIEVILLSFALADKINILKREKEVSQEQALSISLENERIITQQNVILEKNVAERTSELQEANNELTHTLDQLKNTQTQLIESEKMASLGQLTAGIAHEINNPINFVSSNIRPVKRDIDDLFSILNAYSELHQTGVTDKKLQEIEELKNELDIDYIKTELNILLKGMEDGAHRTVEIVKGLKMFSRVDDTDLNMIDINQGIDSTLVILNYQMGATLKLVKDLGNIPNIEGYGGKLNQVFMNIMNNSIHALQNNTQIENPTIWIKTWMVDADFISISFKDNGPGMTPEVRSKMFDPFFTTKPVGEGTGLGLSIVFKIIEAHDGTILVNTEPGEGTEFVITLPILKKKMPIIASHE